MPMWLFYSILALIIYGFWGFFPKLAVNHIRPMSALIYEVSGALVVGLCCLFFVDFRPDFNPKGMLFAVLTGICGMLGTLFFFAAASKGKISVVVSLTALYPLITIFLAAIFLKESLSLKQIMGMIFALIAIYLLSSCSDNSYLNQG